MKLFYLSDAGYGGWPTFTAHLMHGLEQPHLFKVGNRTEGQHRPFGRGVAYRNLSIGDACAYAEGSLIVVAAPKQADNAAALIKAGASLVIHDPTEVKSEATKALIPKARNVITVRKSNINMLRDLGADPLYIPHPYKRCPVHAEAAHRMLACSISRIDFDKHIDLIAEANTLLAPQRIAIYGYENRLYTHHKLDQKVPHWREHYRGAFPKDTLWGGYRMARLYRTVVDMSVIVGDGGGTQYTHLEAFDAGCNLVLNKGWFQEGGEVNRYVQFANTPVELAKLVSDTEWDGTDDPQDLLDEHDAVTVAQQYEEVLA